MTQATIKELQYPVNCLALNRVFPERYPYLLESTASGGCGNARYDILFAFPLEILRRTELVQRQKDQQQDFLSKLDMAWQQAAICQECPTELPFTGGWFVYLGYEIAAEIEHRLRLPLPETGLPLAFATRIPVALINDHDAKKSYVVAEYGYLLPAKQIETDIEFALGCVEPAAIDVEVIEEDNPQAYLDNIKVIKKYIYEGDVFQVNLSRQWSGMGKTEISTLADTLYKNLRMSNPAPFAGIIKIDKQAILSSSPERLVKVKGSTIDTRPIAGTRARGKTQQDDVRLGKELIGNLKERAEHLMLLDLERNDLGRVCRPGTVKVTDLMVVEHYAHVQHIVSNVSGELQSGTTPGNVLRAVFPGGTITGCPKERCMSIIAELEQEGRGAYTGSMGYLNHDGSMDMNILIRTIVVDNNRFYFRAGAGIVADSDAEHELHETRIKAKGMLRALGDSSQ